MCDMGQADRSLYANIKPTKVFKVGRTAAAMRAAEKLGYGHFMDVPDERLDEYRVIFREIRTNG